MFFEILAFVLAGLLLPLVRLGDWLGDNRCPCRARLPGARRRMGRDLAGVEPPRRMARSCGGPEVRYCQRTDYCVAYQCVVCRKGWTELESEFWEASHPGQLSDARLQASPIIPLSRSGKLAVARKSRRSKS